MFPAENWSSIKHRVSSPGSGSKVTLSSFYKRRILKEYTQHSFALFTLLQSGSGRIESAQRLLSPGWATAPLILHTSSWGRRICSSTCENVPFQQSLDQKQYITWSRVLLAGKIKKNTTQIQFSSDRISLLMFVFLNISTFMAQMHLVTIKTELWRKAWQH